MNTAYIPYGRASAALWLALTLLATFTFGVLAAEPDRSAAKASNATERAAAARDELTPEEENTEMPLPGQGYSHSSLLLDKAKDKKAVKEHLDKLLSDGKVIQAPSRER